jgi:TP901 family phage tail tape measure protein
VDLLSFFSVLPLLIFVQNRQIKMGAEARAKTIVTLDGTQAGIVLATLAKQAEAAKSKLEGIDKSIHPKEWNKAKAEYDAITSAQKKFTQSSFELDKVLKNLSGATLKQLDAAYYSLRGQMKNLERDSEAYKAKQHQLIKVEKERKKALSDMTSESGSWGGALSKFAGYTAVGVAAVTGLTYATEKFTEPARNFKQGLADLSALTGLVGKDLDWLGEQATRLSESTVEGGIKITSSAQEILRAYSLMGGAKPELLKNKEALNEVTKQALILKEAAGMETEQAVNSLANAMNQFNAPAEDASKFINVLAAGAQEGAAEIPELTASILRSGTAAKSAKVSIEQLTGMVETLGEKGVKGEEAGTGIRNFLLKLQSGAKETNPAIVGINQALENLAKKNLSASAMTKMFGLENYNAAKLLIENRGRVEELAKAVTGTRSAYEQAATKTDTANASLAQQKNHIENLRKQIGNGLIPVLQTMTKAGIGMLDFLVSLPRLIKQNLPLFTALAVAVTAYSVSLSAATVSEYAHIAAKKLSELWTKRQAIAQTALNLVIKQNPIAFIVSAIALLVGAFMQWYNSSIKVQAVTAGVWEVIKAFAKKMYDLAAGLAEVMAGVLVPNSKLIKRGMDNLKKGMSNWGSEVGDAFKKGYDKKMADWAKYQENLRVIEKNKAKKDKVEDQKVLATPEQASAEEPDEKAAAKAKKEAEEIKKRREELFKSLKKIREDYMASELDQDDKELEAMRNKYAEETAMVREAYAKKYITGKEADDALLNLFNVYHAAYTAKEKEIEDKDKERLRKKREEERKAIEEFEQKKRDVREQYGLMSDDELKGEELKNLLNLHKQKLITTDEFLKAEQDLEDKYRNRKEEKDRAAWEAMRQKIEEKLAFTQTASQMISSMQDAETSRMEANKEKELAAAGSNTEKREAIEKKYQQKKLDIEKKYADANMAMQISQVVASTAVAVMQAFAQLGPIGGAIAAAMLGVTSAFQIASIVSERNRIKNQQLESSSSSSTGTSTVVAAFADGKYDVIAETDGTQYNNVPYLGQAATGLVTRPVLVGEKGDEAIIDGRTLTNIRMNAPGILKAIDAMRVPAYAGGRYPILSDNQQTSGKSVSVGLENAVLLKLNASVEQLNALLPNLKAYVVWQEIKEANQTMESILDRTNRK